jgi:GT2 family glycosyltransferase
MSVLLQNIASPEVSIIILNWNGPRHAIKCLEFLKKITYPNYQVALVNNGLRRMRLRC